MARASVLAPQLFATNSRSSHAVWHGWPCISRSKCIVSRVSGSLGRPQVMSVSGRSLNSSASGLSTIAVVCTYQNSQGNEEGPSRSRDRRFVGGGLECLVNSVLTAMNGRSSVFAGRRTMAATAPSERTTFSDCLLQSRIDRFKLERRQELSQDEQ
jgi:hypothetical protein